MSECEYIVVVTTRSGKVEDVAVCNALSIARRYLADYASAAPTSATVTMYESTPVEVRSGRVEEEAKHTEKAG